MGGPSWHAAGPWEALAVHTTPSHPTHTQLEMGAVPGPGSPSPSPGLPRARLPARSWRAEPGHLVWVVCAGGRAQEGAAGMVTNTG